jgi:hypothetical protein
MLVEFRVKNFRSLRGEQVFSFVASSDRSFRDTHCIATGFKGLPFVTRAAVVYGANATGKSTLMFALATMRNLVGLSTKLTEPQFAEQYTPFRLDLTSAAEPTELEVTIVRDGVRYQYGFSYDAQRIRAEWLIVYRKGKGQHWFERQYDARKKEDVWAPFSSYFKGERETWRKTTRPQALFLTTAVQLNSEQLAPLFDWFINGMTLLTGNGELNPLRTLQRLDDAKFKARILELLRAADINVADIRVDKVPGHQFELRVTPGKPAEISTSDGDIPDVKFVHKAASGELVAFDQRFESAGTQRMFAYAGPVIDAIEGGKLLVIDELDRSLHPLLARFIVRLMHNPAVSTKAAQLWITTHDTTLLDTDLLRRDQIWFVEKDEHQASRLYPLSDFKPRKSEALEWGYLKGRYGGIPFVSEPRFDGSR